MTTVKDPEGGGAEGEAEGDGEGVGGGFGGRLASTTAVLAMTSATASTAAIWALRCRDLITLRIGRLPTCFQQGFCRALRRAAADRFQGVDRDDVDTPRLERHFRFFSGKAHEYAGGSNVIEANVRSLRRKLGDRAGSIETVRGLGYRFSVPVRSEADARI